MIETDQDKPVPQEAIVAAYTPETINARDTLGKRLLEVTEKLKARDAAGTLPERVRVSRYPNDTTAIDLGALPDDPDEALSERRQSKAFAAAAEDFGEPLPGSDSMSIELRERVGEQSDPNMPSIPKPRLKMTWGDTVNGDATTNTLTFYDNGYVEADYSIERGERVHPEGTDELTRRNAEPKEWRFTDIVPSEPRPAALADIQNGAAQLQGTMARYNVVL
jgi:hypothetical protein